MPDSCATSPARTIRCTSTTSRRSGTSWKPVPDRRAYVRPGHDALLPRPALGSAAVDVDRRAHALRSISGADDRGPPDLRRPLQHDGAEAGGRGESRALSAGYRERRLGRRTARTFPLPPPPQKNRSPPLDSSPETSTPGGIFKVSSTFPVWGSTRRRSLSSPSQVPCQSSPSTQVTPVTKRLDSIVRRIAPVSGSI